jgi:hypothetical protein
MHRIHFLYCINAVIKEKKKLFFVMCTQSNEQLCNSAKVLFFQRSYTFYKKKQKKTNIKKQASTMQHLERMRRNEIFISMGLS